MNIEYMNKIAMVVFVSSVVLIILGLISGICGSSLGLLCLVGIGIIGMMIYEWLATYIENWYDNCDEEEL